MTTSPVSTSPVSSAPAVAAEAESAGPSFRRFLPWGLLLLFVLVAALLLGPAGGGGPPLDPSSTRPLGTAGLVATLEELGAVVQVVAGAVPESADTALVLRDDLGDDERGQLRRWVEGGGTLVVADLGSPLAGFAPATGDTADGPERRCAAPALAAASRLEVPVALRAVPAGALACYTAGDGAWLVAVGAGAGRVVALGSPGPFVNEHLGSGDHAVIAAALLAPTGTEEVVIVEPAPPGSGERSLADLVGSNVRNAGWQLVVAFALYACWRARRLGQPVDEPALVTLDASTTVLSLAALRQRAGARAAAVDRIAGAARRDLARLGGLAAGAPIDDIATAVAARTGIDRDRIVAALDPAPPADDAALLAAARSIHAVRQEATDAG